MAAEGVVGLIAGLAAGSIALVGWALGSGIEGLASVIVVWRFTGSRMLSESAERRAQRAVAVSFWLLAPYIAIEAVRDLAAHHPASATPLGIVLTASSLVIMPILGIAKRRLGERLGSGATAGEGTQNLMCAAQAAGVLLALVVVAVWPGGWPIDPIIALAIAAGRSGKDTGPGAAQTAANQTEPRPGESRSRAISVPLARVGSGISRLLTDNCRARSARSQHTNTSLCKQVFGRFPALAWSQLRAGCVASTGRSAVRTDHYDCPSVKKISRTSRAA